MPLSLDPIAFSIGSFSVRWYAACFLLGFVSAWAVLYLRTKKGVGPCDSSCLADLVPMLFFGILAGGRIGYALFYDAALFSHPLSLVSPFDPASGAYVGIRGMSFFGALLGGGVTLALFTRFRDLRFLDLSDTLVPVAPIALFFGRIGNFLNGELYGRPTDMPWGMRFPAAPDGGALLRHPSQLYEAGLEGVFLFLVLLSVARKRPGRGVPTAVFLTAYAAARFFAERFRQPDIGSGFLFGTLTEGQLFSVVLFMVGVSVGFLSCRRHDRLST